MKIDSCSWLSFLSCNLSHTNYSASLFTYLGLWRYISAYAEAIRASTSNPTHTCISPLRVDRSFSQQRLASLTPSALSKFRQSGRGSFSTTREKFTVKGANRSLHRTYHAYLSPFLELTYHSLHHKCYLASDPLLPLAGCARKTWLDRLQRW